MNRSTENLRYTPSLSPKLVGTMIGLVAIAIGTVIAGPVGASDPQLLAEHLYNAANRPVMVTLEAPDVAKISLALIDADAARSLIRCRYARGESIWPSSFRRCGRFGLRVIFNCSSMTSR